MSKRKPDPMLEKLEGELDAANVREILAFRKLTRAMTACQKIRRKCIRLGKRIAARWEELLRPKENNAADEVSRYLASQEDA